MDYGPPSLPADIRCDLKWPFFCKTCQVVKAKDKELQVMLQEGDVPLRDGVTKLIDDALAADVRVGLLCGTASQKVGGLSEP